MRTEYQFREIEKAWQGFWETHKTFQAQVNPAKPKYYVLDMFPYPSGAGLHVGHPLGYIASDIMARYKRLQSNMRFKRDSIQRLRRNKISLGISSN